MSERIYKNIWMFGLAALMIFTPLVRGTVRLWSMTPVFLVIYFLLFLWFWKMTDRGTFPRVLKISIVDRLIFTFLFLAAVSMILSIYKHDSLYAFMRLLGYVGIYYLIVYNFDDLMKKRLLVLSLYIGVGLSLYGLLQYVGILGHSWWFPPEFLAATYVNHNHFSGYLELVIPVTLGILMQQKRGSLYIRWGLILALCIMCVAFIFAQSRGGWVSLGVSFLIMNIIFIKKGILKKNSIFIFLFIAILLFSFLLMRSSINTSRLTQSDEVLSLNGRLSIWQGTVQMVKERPFLGVGIGDFDKGFYRYRPAGFDLRAVYAHNEYLQMAAEMGILAPLLMLCLFIAVLVKGLRKSLDLVIAGCCCGVLSLCLHGWVDFNFHIPANMLLFTIWLACIMSQSCKGEQESV
jgi:O-antigen ligase